MLFRVLLVWYFSHYSVWFQFFTYVLNVCHFWFSGLYFSGFFQQSDEPRQYFSIFRRKPYYIDWRVIYGEHNMVKRWGRDGWSSEAIYCVHIVLTDQKLLLFHITSAWNHKVMMFLLQIASFEEHKWYLSDLSLFTNFISL